MPTNSLHPNSHHAARRPRRRRLLALGLAASLTALGALIPAAAGAAPQATPAAQAFQAAGDLTHEEHLLLEGLDVDYILSHLAYIEDNIGPGIGGSPAERHRAEYLGGQLQALGYEPWTFATGQDGTDDYIQEFSDTSVAATIVGSVTLNGREYAANGPAYNANGVYKGFNTPEVTGQTVYYPTLADATAAPAADVAGKIVLTIRGAGTAGRTEYAAGAATLEANGAIALVAIHPKYTVAATGKVSAETAFSAVTSGTQVNIPVVLTSYLDGKAILAALDDGAGNIQSGTLTVRNARGDKSVNVLAFKPAAEPTNRTVIIGGHLDSKIGTTGANDNLSGPAVILGIAKALQDVPTKYNIVFAFWGSEELGLRGSRAFYSSTLAPDAYWKNIIAYYNLDMAATSQLTNAYLTQHTAYRDTSTSPATALRSWAGDTVAVQADRYWDYANANGELATWWKKEYIDPATGNVTALGLEYYGSCSDHASISGANAGVVYESSVPAVYTFWRDAGVNTGAGAVVEYNYHVVGDRYIWPADEDQFSLQGETELYQGNISPERAKILGSVYLLTLARVAGGPVYPQALDLTAAGTPGRVTATWEAPDDGGSAITGYSLRLVPSSGTAVTVQVAASATSYTFEGVAAGTYTVKASATNAIGTSPVVTSAAVDVAPATAPAAPAAPVLTASGDSSLVITWQAPADDGGSVITGYELALSDGTVVRVGASTLRYVWSGLTPGGYSATLKAVNAVGESAGVDGAGQLVVVEPPRQYGQLTLSPDLTGNGLGDIVALTTAGTAHVHSVNTNGTIVATKTLATDLTGHSVYGAGDWNGNGKADILTVSASGALYLRAGLGAGKVAAPVQIGRGWSGYQLVPSGDLDGDKVADLLAIDSAGVLWLYAGNGQGAFKPGRTQVGKGWTSFTAFAAADLNKDGKNDLLGVGASGVLYAYLGKGNGQFQAAVQVGKGWSGFSLAAGADLTGDGLADIVGRNNTTGVTYLYRGKGGGAFQAASLLALNW